MTSELEITLEQFNDWKKQSVPFSLIDVREKEEREESHIGGIFIPLSSLFERTNEIPQGNVVIYCRSGARSLFAAAKLREALKRDDIYSLAGGILKAYGELKEVK